MGLKKIISISIILGLFFFDAEALSKPRAKARGKSMSRSAPKAMAKRPKAPRPKPKAKPRPKPQVAAAPKAAPKADSPKNLEVPFQKQKPSPYKNMAAKPPVPSPTGKPPVAAKPKALEAKPLANASGTGTPPPKIQLANGRPPVGNKDGANAALVKQSITDTAPARKNGAIFWSKGGMAGAEAKANELNKKHPGTKHSSLEMIANNAPMKLPNGAATPSQQKAWGNASEKFGHSASGKTRMVMGEGKWRDDNFFNTVEKPILTKPLNKGGKVTQVNVFEPDPKTGQLKKTHRWYNDGSPWDGPGSQPGGEWKRNLAPKKDMSAAVP